MVLGTRFELMYESVDCVVCVVWSFDLCLYRVIGVVRVMSLGGLGSGFRFIEFVVG